jgi:outer membrane receptor protein involved in Fe transport
VLAAAALAAPAFLGAQPAPASAPSSKGATVEGTLVVPPDTTGKSVAGLSVMVVETGEATRTDAYGHFTLSHLRPGTYTLIVSGPGYSRLKITDVTATEGSPLFISPQEMPVIMKDGKVQPMEEVVINAAKEGKEVQVMERYLVTEESPAKAYSDANVDIPRTINDARPYYIIDNATLEKSGAFNTEDFLKNQLTMNDEMLTNAQNSTSYGTQSGVSLHGLGVAQTLILVNGVRVANSYVAGTIMQTDINGIPLSQIDRIEVLPSAAAGIYGGSAMGGVINIVLKSNYTGGELRLGYDSSTDTDDSIKSVSGNWGSSLEGGKSHIRVSFGYSTQKPISWRDRLGLFERNVTRILNNMSTPAALALFPSGVTVMGGTPINPFTGSTTNISSGSATTPLVLRNGTSIGSNYTFIPFGTSASTAAATLGAGLIQNAGHYNLNLPSIVANQTGLNTPMGFTPKIKQASISFDRQMLPNLNLSASYDLNENNGTEVYGGQAAFSNYTIPASAPTNPFNSAVIIKFPAQQVALRTGPSVTRKLTLTAKAKLPFDWNGLFQFTWSSTAGGTFFKAPDSTVLQTYLNTGVINPFVDETLYPIDLSNIAYSENFSFLNTSNNLDLHLAGPLFRLPWGTPTLTLVGEQFLVGTHDGTIAKNDPVNAANGASFLEYYYGLNTNTKAVAAELDIPLVATGRIPLLYSAEAEISGRNDSYQVALGTQTGTIAYPTGSVSYGSPTIGGLPYRTKATFERTNPSIGIKIQPVKGLTFRASTATAFQPPLVSQLLQNPIPSTTTTAIIDPKNGAMDNVYTIGGGNPNVSPQSARSWQWGIIWEPTEPLLRGLRIQIDHTQLRQFNAISSLNAQQIVNYNYYQGLYPGRITRDPTTGQITLVDISSVNLYGRYLTSYDLKADYQAPPTPFGTFTFHAMETMTLHSIFQFSQSLPAYENVNHPLEGGAVKYRANTSVVWEKGNWTATWGMRIIGSYKEYGAPGGSLSYQIGSPPGVGAYSYYTIARGSDTIPTQIYHDLTLSYAFGSKYGATSQAAGGSKSFLNSEFMNNVTVTVGLKDALNTAPPFDTYSVPWTSYFEDWRMRAFWMTIRKDF